MFNSQTLIPLPLESETEMTHVIDGKVSPSPEEYTFFICQRIFQSQGITWTPSERGSLRGSFQKIFPQIYQEANLIAQPLKLHEMWWQEDLGPMLALTSDNIPCALLPFSKGGYKVIRPDGVEESFLDNQIVQQFVQVWRFIPQFIDSPLTLPSIIKLIHKSIQKDWLYWVSLQMTILILGVGISYLSAAIFNTAVPLASLGILHQMLSHLIKV